MIHIAKHYILTWDGRVWRDKAGHVWKLDEKTGAFISDIHGHFYDWKTEDKIEIG